MFLISNIIERLVLEVEKTYDPIGNAGGGEGGSARQGLLTYPTIKVTEPSPPRTSAIIKSNF